MLRMDKHSIVLLYSTANYIQNPVIVIMEKNMKNNICVRESLCCTAESNTTLYINYTSSKNFL